MSKEAFIGPAGAFVRTVDPHTEADPHALLITFLVGVGNLIGHPLHVPVGGDRHHANVFAVLVGRTGRGRKGSSESQVRKALERVDPAWASDCRATGLSSGEGLIWSVRDRITKINKAGDEAVVDAGVDDKRLYVVEPEFSSTLKVAGREGNTLSPVIRQAWDTGTLRTMTKNSPARATNAHISIIGHITQTELLAT